MSETETLEAELDPELELEEVRPKEPDGLAKRSFPVELYPGVGRTVDLRIVPYGERATVADGLGGVPFGVQYEEEFLPGVFDGQLNAAHRVYLDHEHGDKLSDVVGRGLELASRSDGFYGSFRFLDDADGDKALLLVREGVLTGASVSCFFKKSIRTANGVVQRAKAHLDRVALCRQGVYPGAVVLGLRSALPELDEELLPVPFEPELAERLERLGLEVPNRLRAHPATGTPVNPGTPDDGTRRSDVHVDTGGSSYAGHRAGGSPRSSS